MKGFAVLLVACVAVAHAEYDVPVCPSEQEDNWGIELLLRHEECNKFYKCTLGHPVEYRCYDGLYFNLDTWQCDWKYNVDCNGRVIPEEDLPSTPLIPVPSTFQPPTNTTQATNTTTTEPTTSTTTIEPTTPEPTTEPTTTTTTTEPTTPEPTTEPTTPTTEPPTTTTTAVPPTSVTNSTIVNTTTTTTTTPAPESETEAQPEEEEIIFQENGCPVDPHIHWLLPNEEDCNQFYYCVWGGKVARQCPAGLHFNTKLQVCDWPAAAGCTAALNKHFQFRQMLRQLL